MLTGALASLPTSPSVLPSSFLLAYQPGYLYHLLLIT
jgi:hypothetical protein